MQIAISRIYFPAIDRTAHIVPRVPGNPDSASLGMQLLHAAIREAAYDQPTAEAVMTRASERAEELGFDLVWEA